MTDMHVACRTEFEVIVRAIRLGEIVSDDLGHTPVAVRCISSWSQEGHAHGGCTAIEARSTSPTRTTMCFSLRVALTRPQLAPHVESSQ
mmetsp:Transcript_4704/g.12537  ORF Transcript_4704/g.12537 Transcript_4704/m.12537 type:complete len:89 (+) Transcript_4704:1101-1367(+)